jgi:hypothetical protein
MINPAVNKNIDTANSRAATAQDQNIVSLINKTKSAIKARGGNVESPAAKALVNRAIMIYEQGRGTKVVTASSGTFTYGQYNGKELKDLNGIERRAYEASLKEHQAQVNKQAAIDAAKATGTTGTGTTGTGTTGTGTTGTGTTGTDPVNPVDIAGEEESTTAKTPEELAAEAKAAEEAAAKAAADAEKERLKGMADTAREGQRQLVVDVSSDPTAAITSPDVETIMNKTYDADGNLTSSILPAGTTVADSAGKVATPLAIAGKKGEYVPPVMSEDGTTVVTPGYYPSTGPKGVAVATEVDQPDDITATKTTTKTAIGDTKSALSGGERDYLTVPLENVEFKPMEFEGGVVPPELAAQLEPTEEEQAKLLDIELEFKPQIGAAVEVIKGTEAFKAWKALKISHQQLELDKYRHRGPGPTEEEKIELTRLETAFKETPEYIENSKIIEDLQNTAASKSKQILDVTFHNPTTGEKITVDRETAVLSNPPEGFVKGEPEGKFKDGSLESAQGTVSDEAKVTAAQGDSKSITGTGLDKIAQLGTNIFDADGNVIVDKNGEPIKGNFTQIDALDDTTKRKLLTEDVYDADGKIVSRKETLDETGFTTEEQKDIDDTIAKTKAAQIDTGARDTYDKDGNLVKKGDKGYTVKAQLDDLMGDFEGGATPAWAAGAMRAASAAMAARGLGASSMAGQAIIQATMESALPIAQADAATIAQFERDNLSNRQQVTVLASQQRAEFLKVEFDQKFQAKVLNAAKISDIANLNFTADQQITLENARLAQTANISNMNAKNAKVMADASAMATMDLKNLDNKQQAAVQNAKSFLEMDMANLDNAQEASMFKAQAIAAAILSDTAAENASRQFNASSENQTNQFMANLKTSVDLATAAQKNAISMSNADAENTLDQFNASLQENRTQFETSNGLVIAQANAQWRQNAETLDTAAQNEANMIDAATINTFTKAVIDQIWQRERDLMDYAFKGSEQEKDRMVSILLGDKTAEAYAKIEQTRADSAEDTAKTQIFYELVFG